MSIVVSASRRTDLAASFPDILAGALREEKARVHGPAGRAYDVDLRPENVHTLVLWSKDFANYLADRSGLRGLTAKYEQVYFHITITGLGGTFLEKGVPLPDEALAQIPGLAAAAGSPARVSVRFDPVVFWRDGGKLLTNLPFFDRLAPRVAAAGIEDVRVSFAQWYGKAKRRAEKGGFEFVDPDESEKRARALEMAATAAKRGLSLHACAQAFLAAVPGFKPSSCIDGRRLRELHPRHEALSIRKDRTQRPECLCTESKDIGSYTLSCPHGCIYCYANPK
ncbi:MAG TPA: DUF1848 family protein [Acidobacteriota bacterium]|nr:DUF1848 family protein [Acidobacteriota bacterium]